MRRGLLVLLALVVGTAAADCVQWEFPRTGSCHEGLPFSDGVTGVLVWGGGDTINLTVGRADLWDHRGGYPWTPEQSYTNIVALVQAGKKDELEALFKKETPAGEPRNPYMLPLGRVVVKLQGGATLKRGELDPFTGLGKLVLSDGKVIELAMGKFFYGLFAVKFPNDAKFDIELKNCMEFPGARDALASVGFKPARYEDWTSFRVERGGSFFWQIPEDNPVGLNWWASKGELFVRTNRGDKFPSWRGPAPVFSNVSKKSVDHWKAFWARSAKVKVPDPVLQREFDYGMYRFGAMTDPDGVPAGLQGPWLEDDRLVPWNGDYHFNINVQECYSPAFRGGHFAHLMPLFKMVLSWRPRLRENAKKFVGINDGYVLPHSVDDRGVCIGGFWTGTIDHASTAWVASMMYRYVKYSGDIAFLKSDAYDFMKGAMNVYRAMMEEYRGRLSLPMGPSPEFGGDDVKTAVGRDPSFQLAAAHRLARDLIDAAGRLGEKPDPMWLDVEKRLPAYTVAGNGIGLFEGRPFPESHRHHSHLAGFYPFDTIDMKADPELVSGTFWNWTVLGTGAWTGWCVPWASILRTHVGHPEAAADLLRAWDRYFCNPGHGSCHDAQTPGFSAWAWRNVMQMDGQCAAVTAVMELMVHEVNGKVEFFRGCPAEWKEVSFENVRLSDGTAVSGRRVNGKVETWPAQKPSRPSSAVRKPHLYVGISDICAQDLRLTAADCFYAKALQKAGHVPVLIPATTDSFVLDETVARLDALILTGGEDVDPTRYGAARGPNCGKPNLGRDAYEWRLLEAAKRRRLPVFGICRGCQMLNVFLGGTLYQDINSECTPPGGGEMRHRSTDGWYARSETNAPAHTVAIVKGTRFASVVGEGDLAVNSHHHQAVRRLAPGSRAAAISSDGVVEAWESTVYPAAGVQFHPEVLYSVGRNPGFDYGRLAAIFVRLGDLLGGQGGVN